MGHETTLLLPAIRSYIGDWIYYNTVMALKDIAQHIKNPTEIHESAALADWIQREHIQKHSEDIAKYLKNNPQRFLGSLIVGVYGGEPMWSPIDIDFSKISSLGNLDPQQTSNLEGKMGILVLNGNENLFAIDGQHRVSGIKTAVENGYITEEVKKESIAVIFVAHNPTSEGKKRTRRLFSTVNRKAKRVAKYSNIALDEDDGFAIVTRNLVDTYPLFANRNNISYTSSTGALPRTSNALTSIVGLYYIVMELYPKNNKKRKLFSSTRPPDEEWNRHLDLCKKFFDILLEHCGEYKKVFQMKERSASYYKEGINNHLLFRPVGQKGFAQAVEVLMSREMKIEDAIKVLLSVNLYITKEPWHGLAWNPDEQSMITKKLGQIETHLLKSSNNPARNKRMEKNYQQLRGDVQ